MTPIQRRIAAWLREKQRTKSSLARELGISPSYLTMILAGKKVPSLRVAKRFQEVTSIPATDFDQRVA